MATKTRSGTATASRKSAAPATRKVAPKAGKPSDGAAPSTAGRLESIDALRGFNTFWIIGGAELLSEIAKVVNVEWLNAVSANFTQHVEWEGFHFHDMIFPLFLFIMGVTTPFSVGKRREKGDGTARLAGHVILRMALLFLFGLIYSGMLRFEGLHELRIFGVLQRLGLAWGFAALTYLVLNTRGQIAVGTILLFVYWGLMALVPVPGHPLASYTPEGNVANYVDRLILLPGQMYQKYGDPEGLLSTIPAITTALLGIFAGTWLKGSKPASGKVLGLLAAGAIGIALGYAWSPWFPVIKKIWTSSYVLVAGGWSAILLAAFYGVIDGVGWNRWAYFWVVIGLNPITIYLGQRLIDFDKIAENLLGGAAKYSGVWAAVLLAAGVLAIKWLCLHFLHRQRIYLKV
jgi:predicted acyltransferase